MLFAILLVGTARAADTSTKPKTGAHPMVTLTTNHGDIVLELDEAKAPISVQNFLSYVDAGFYDGLIFHRVIPGFMIQGGGMTPDLREKRNNAPIKNEADNGLLNARGTIAMARTQVVDSATSQFFINVADNAFLNHGKRDFGYAVFGRVVSGMETVDKIAAVKTGHNRGHSDVPMEPVTILKARRT
ncbi:MAG: peptidyl-prolyl cis-trans isomerase [Magnetococcales bacterium]|nr:peptidyl-prolyl cis-trans isomerase [Magnetococcales bacterium]NGZ07562.1 peptidyl-prolyl cis-trans isomerase [Magnetococcales bacterium]